MDGQPRVKLEIDGEVLKCRDQKGTVVWETPISKIVLIAEYTSNEGPWIDDYYLHFWTNEGGQLFRCTATLHADGRDEMLQSLSAKLGAKLELGLCDATWWTSRIVWPPELLGHVYYSFRESQPKSWLQRALSALLWPNSRVLPN